MKEYSTPVLEIAKFDTVDIVTVSGNVPAILSSGISDALKYKGYSSADVEWEN